MRVGRVTQQGLDLLMQTRFRRETLGRFAFDPNDPAHAVAVASFGAPRLIEACREMAAVTEVERVGEEGR